MANLRRFINLCEKVSPEEISRTFRKMGFTEDTLKKGDPFYAALYQQGQQAALVFKVLLRQGWKLPTGIWVSIAGHEQSVEITKEILRVYPETDLRRVAIGAAYEADKNLMVFATSQIGWDPEFLFNALITLPSGPCKAKFLRWASLESKISASDFLNWAVTHGKLEDLCALATSTQ